MEERECWALYAKALSDRPIVCPWNPFPPGSAWGRKLDEMYRQSLKPKQD